MKSLISGTDTAQIINNEPRMKYWVNFANGVLNTKTMEFSNHSPNYFFTSKLSFNYNPEAKMDQSMVDFLVRISSNNSITLNVLRSFCYLLLTRYNKWHLSLYIWGPAGTGKSKFRRTLLLPLWG